MISPKVEGMARGSCDRETTHSIRRSIYRGIPVARSVTVPVNVTWRSDVFFCEHTYVRIIRAFKDFLHDGFCESVCRRITEKSRNVSNWSPLRVMRAPLNFVRHSSVAYCIKRRSGRNSTACAIVVSGPCRSRMRLEKNTCLCLCNSPVALLLFVPFVRSDASIHTRDLIFRNQECTIDRARRMSQMRHQCFSSRFATFKCQNVCTCFSWYYLSRYYNYINNWLLLFEIF